MYFTLLFKIYALCASLVVGDHPFATQGICHTPLRSDFPSDFILRSLRPFFPSLNRRPLLIPFHLLLIGVAGAQHRDFVKRPADDLQGNR